MIALLARKALQVVHIIACAHHHLERRNHLVARRAQSGAAEQPQVVAFAQHQIRLGVQRRAHLAQPAAAAAALQAVLVPVQVKRAEQEAFVNGFTAFGARLIWSARVGGGENRFGFGAVHGHIWSVHEKD